MTEISRAESWEAIRAAFAWRIPDRYNLAEDLVGRRARSEPDRIALRHLPTDAPPVELSYAALERLACRYANLFDARGIARGDRIGVLLAQSPETLATHLAGYKLGAVVVPLFTLFGPDALEFRLRDAGVRLLVTDRANAGKIAELRDRLPALETVLATDGPTDGALALAPLLEQAADRRAPVETGPNDPAFLSYTSGTTGPPKGALHAHRVILGHVPGVQLAFERFPQPGDAMWTPADWAWMGGLCNVALPALRFGVPLLSHRMERFDPDRAFWILERFAIRASFLPPTALKLMRAAGPGAARPRPRALASGGESLGAELLDWGRETFALTINEFYGQTECNLVLGNSAGLAPVRAGAMGRAFPGSDVAILGEEGETPLPPGTPGEIAVRRGDAAMFLGYWQNPAKTAEKFRGDWLLTGDEGVMDPDGYFRFASRSDDVITSSGYRVGPSEIEDCLTGHPAVAMAAVIGQPDPVRTERIAAVVTLTAGHTGSPALEADLIARVRTRLSPHLAPRSVAFVDAMPMTATGKILRRALRNLG